MSSRELGVDAPGAPEAMPESMTAAGQGLGLSETERGADARSRQGPVAWLGEALEAERAHWFYWLPVAMGAGIAAYFALPVEPPLALGVVIVLGVIAARFALPTPPLLRLLLDILLVAAIGFCLIMARSWWVSAPIIGQRLGPIEVRGFIELIEPREGPGDRLTIRVTRLGTFSVEEMPKRIRVRSMARDGEVLNPGDAIIVSAHLAPPAGPALPDGFDFGRHAYFAGIGAVGYAVTRPVRDADAELAPLSLRISAQIQRLRRAIGARVDQVLSGEAAAIAKALVTGERGGISEATNAAYRDSGLFHILSISGLHMAIMGGAVFFTVRLLLALFPSLALRYPVKKWAALAAGGGSLAYLAISGTSFATVRAFIMISIMFLAVLLDRPAIALRNVALSALIILVLFPESLLDIGFQMSFAAVVALIAVYDAVRVRVGDGRPVMRGYAGMGALFLGGIVLSTIVASVAVTPFAIYHFHKTQHYAVLANLLAVPICNFIVMPAALATLVFMPFGLEAWPLLIMGYGVDAMSGVARLVASLPGAVGVLPAIPTDAFMLMLAGGLWLVLWQQRWRLGGIVLICAGVALAPFAVRPDVLIGRDGRLVAVRNPAGQFAALPAPQSQFELKRWLEHDGDGRSVAEAVATAGFTCDAVGCAAKLRGLRVAISRHAASIGDDCALADLMVLAVPAPRGCVGPQSVIDFFDARIKGTHAVYVEGPRRIRVVTVADTRGVRPWAPLHPWSREARARVDARDRTTSRAPAASPFHRRSGGAGRFAAPLEMLDALRLPRPEIEDSADGDGWNEPQN